MESDALFPGARIAVAAAGTGAQPLAHAAAQPARRDSF